MHYITNEAYEVILSSHQSTFRTKIYRRESMRVRSKIEALQSVPSAGNLANANQDRFLSVRFDWFREFSFPMTAHHKHSYVRQLI